MTKPTVAEFKAYFFRDFPYGVSLDMVTDMDIAKAQVEASLNFNEALWDTQEYYSMAFNYLTAHYLVMDLRAASQGIAGSYSWLTTNKSVGSVSEGYSIPQRIMDNPYLAMLSKTNYGAKYLSLALPSLTGQMFTVCGATHA
jgi:hypothetical protein